MMVVLPYRSCQESYHMRPHMILLEGDTVTSRPELRTRKVLFKATDATNTSTTLTLTHSTLQRHGKITNITRKD